MLENLQTKDLCVQFTDSLNKIIVFKTVYSTVCKAATVEIAIQFTKIQIPPESKIL